MLKLFQEGIFNSISCTGPYFSWGGLICIPLFMAKSGGEMAQEVRSVVWQSEDCRFDPTLAVSKCP